MTSNRIQVVFGYGAIGRAVTRALLERGETVRVVRRSPSPSDPRLQFVVGDATDAAQTRALCADATHVYQCTNAADYHRWPQQFPPLQQGIIAGAAANGATLVVLENMYVYGSQGGAPLYEGLPLRGVGARASTRVAMTRQLDALRLPVVRVRAADLIGPFVRESMAGPRLLAPILGGERRVFLLADPDLPHAIAYAADVGEAMVVAGLDNGAAGRVFHAPHAPEITPRQLVAKIAAVAGRPTPQLLAPPRWLLPLLLPIAGSFVPPMRGIGENAWMFYEPFIVDSSRYRERYGIHVTPIDDAIRATVEAFRPQTLALVPAPVKARGSVATTRNPESRGQRDGFVA